MVVTFSSVRPTSLDNRHFPALTTIVPVIQLWYLQSYWYVPGTPNAWVYADPEFMFPESNEAHAGALVEVTVCAAESSFVQVTVLFIPITSVILSSL
jgi:hypothetical protein